MRRRLLLLVAALAAAHPAPARTVVVGEGGLSSLADALQVAVDGDTIRLGPGEYFECAILKQRDLVIEGAGPQTIVTDKACEGKALLVARGGNLTVRNLVLARARVPDLNGAGIRLEAQGLTLERVRFENDQVGLLAGQGGPGQIHITDCAFEGGGVAGDRPTAALMVGAVALLRVERTTFRGVKGGQIVTEADRTELVGDRIETGAQDGAGHAVRAAGGTLVMRDSVVVLGPGAPPRDTAILATGAGVELRGNRLENTTGRASRLLLDWTGSTPVLEANVVPPGDTLVSSSGVWRYRAGGVARGVYGTVRGIAGATKRSVLGAVGR